MNKLVKSAPIIATLIANVPPSQIEQEIRELEEKQKSAILSGDIEALSTIMSPQMLVNNPLNRVITFDEVKMLLNSGKIDYEAYDQTIEKISIFDNVAIVMGQEVTKPHNNAMNVGKNSYPPVYKCLDEDQRTVADYSPPGNTYHDRIRISRVAQLEGWLMID